MAKDTAEIISDKVDGDVRFITMKSKFADTQINVCKDLNMVVINKTFSASGILHHTQLTIQEFRELQKLLV